MQRKYPNKKKQNRAKLIASWLLFLTLLPYTVVKDLHHHEVSSGGCANQKECGHHGDKDKGSCPICDFTLSPFVKAEPAELPSVTEFVCLFLCRDERPFSFHVSYSRGLRAPPAIS